MSAIKSEEQISCTLNTKNETKLVNYAQEDPSVNVIPKTERSFFSDYIMR